MPKQRRQYSKQRDGRQSELFKNVCEKFAIAKIKELNLLGACLDVVSIRFGFIRNLTTSIYYLFVVFYSAIHNKLRRYGKAENIQRIGSEATSTGRGQQF